MLYLTKGGTKSKSFSNPTPMTLLPLSTLLPILPLSLPLPCYLTLVPGTSFVPLSLTTTHATMYPPTVIAPTSPMPRLPSQRHDEAMASPNAVEWLMACEDEMRTWKQLDVYDIVPRPKERKIVGSKWVFHIKQGPDGTIQKYKA